MTIDHYTTLIKADTSSGLWAPFCRQILDFLRADTIDLLIDGRPVHGYRSPDSPALWIRDHSDMLRGARYIDPDVKSAVDGFAQSQHVSGRIYDFVTTKPVPGTRENWESWVRVPVEADVEFRWIKGAFLAWQATGDTDWVQNLLPALDRALTYTCTHPLRWDEKHGLVKRPYTIDTWDFDYTAGRYPWLNFQITDETFWGLFHGDNSGTYEAARCLTTLYQAVGHDERAQHWKAFADGLRQRANTLLFNGRFYTHFYKLTPVTVPGVNEAEQLSFSNPMAVNRGLATHKIAVEVLNEYRRRRKPESFAEWYGIDPPFPDGIFGDEKLVAGAYINGGIFPLCGGELARAALFNGFETYGVKTLHQYRKMIAETGATYLWYFPDGQHSSVENSTSPEAMPTDGWGASAMLYGWAEGLCGIEDLGHSYQTVRCSPRWIAAGETEADIELGYAASGASFGYAFRHDTGKQRIQIELKGQADVDLNLLLPPGCRAEKVLWDGRSVAYHDTHVQQRTYAVVQGAVQGRTGIEVQYTSDVQPERA